MQRNKILNSVKHLLEPKPEIVFAYIFGSVMEQEVFRDVDVAFYVGM